MSQSEVAKLLQEVEDNFRAAQSALTGLSAGSATHTFITKKMEAINGQRVILSAIVGSDQAMQLIAERLDNI